MAIGGVNHRQTARRGLRLVTSLPDPYRRLFNFGARKVVFRDAAPFQAQTPSVAASGGFTTPVGTKSTDDQETSPLELLLW